MSSRVWGLALTLALTLAVFLAGRATVDAIRQDERARVLAEGRQLEDQRWAIERARWARERDSLVAETGKRDTVLRWRIQTVREVSWLPADTATAVRYAACRTQLEALADECETFRTTALATITAAEQLHAADTVRARELRYRLDVTRDSLARVTRDRDRRPTWRAVGLAAGFGWLVSFVR